MITDDNTRREMEDEMDDKETVEQIEQDEKFLKDFSDAKKGRSDEQQLKEAEGVRAGNHIGHVASYRWYIRAASPYVDEGDDLHRCGRCGVDFWNKKTAGWGDTLGEYPLTYAVFEHRLGEDTLVCHHCVMACHPKMQILCDLGNIAENLSLAFGGPKPGTEKEKKFIADMHDRASALLGMYAVWDKVEGDVLTKSMS